jgi:hypothetical protein
MGFPKLSSPSAHTGNVRPGRICDMKRLLALGALAVSLSSCLGVQVDVFSASNLTTAKEPCNSAKELEISFDYVAKSFDKLTFVFTPNGATTPTTVTVLPDVSTTGFRRYGTSSNQYQMAIDLKTVTSSPTVTTQAVEVTPAPTVPQPNPQTIYPMDISLTVSKSGYSSIKMSVLNVNVAKCYGLQ